jgi:Spy/CpxP family protein refolding chaperone
MVRKGDPAIMSIRRIYRTVLTAAAIGLLAAGGLFAGKLFAGSLPQEDPAEFAPRIFARIARHLDLTEEQRGEIKGILKSHAAQIQAQIAAGRSARRALADAVMAEPSDEAAIRARAEEFGRVHADGAVLIARLRSEIAPILTAEQREELARFQQRLRRRGDRAARSCGEFLKSES